MVSARQVRSVRTLNARASTLTLVPTPTRTLTLTLNHSNPTLTLALALAQVPLALFLATDELLRHLYLAPTLLYGPQRAWLYVREPQP